MSDRCFLDTNIFVYAVDSREPAKSAVAEELIESSLRNRAAVTSYQVIQEFVNVVTGKFTRPLPPDQVQR